MKKLIQRIEYIIKLLLWSYIYLIVSNMFFVYFWNFNILSAQSWNLIQQYWDHGGKIQIWQDYLLLFLLIFYLPLWLIGWKKAKKVKLTNLVLYPITKYHQYKLNKYEKETSHISIKNMGVHGPNIEEEITQKSKSTTKIVTDAGVNKIRESVAEKISSVKHK